MITVKELKEELSKYPDDLIVVTEGYENGYNEIEKIETKSLFKRKFKSWWDGDYSIISSESGGEKIKCLYFKSRETNY